MPFFVRSENDLSRSGEHHGKGGPITLYDCDREGWLPPGPGVRGGLPRGRPQGVHRREQRGLHRCGPLPLVTSTCRMGPASDPGAVVDQFGRVHGMDGLRVVDASIMPRPTRGDTNATTIAMAERMSDLISGDSGHVVR